MVSMQFLDLLAQVLKAWLYSKWYILLEWYLGVIEL
jgi:hypothetical protein